MADGYLETHYAEYEQRKAAWLSHRRSLRALLAQRARTNATSRPQPSAPQDTQDTPNI